VPEISTQTLIRSNIFVMNALPLNKNFFSQLAQQDAVLVTVEATRGSVPRNAGAWMAVFAGSQLGTIGGGRLEWDAARQARTLLQTGIGPCEPVRYALGPTLGQCCGGEVWLRLRRVGAADAQALQQQLAGDRTPVALFGAGHVGQALVQVLSRLPFDLVWLDSRGVQADGLDGADGVPCEYSDPVQAAVPGLKPGSRVLIMSFSHAEDFELVAACLLRQRLQADLPFVGLIGSKSKWASFRQRLRARGFGEDELARVTCPIGVAGIQDKRPEAIAIAVAAQLLQVGLH
jgi:xanthine dehydrogenase accessory factor